MPPYSTSLGRLSRRQHRDKFPSVPESSQHRNRRRTRSDARGLITAAKLGIEVPPAAVEAAKAVLSGHHATEESTMQKWQQQQIQQCVLNMMNGNFSGSPSGFASMPSGGGHGARGNRTRTKQQSQSGHRARDVGESIRQTNANG